MKSQGKPYAPQELIYAGHVALDHILLLVHADDAWIASAFFTTLAPARALLALA